MSEFNKESALYTFAQQLTEESTAAKSRSTGTHVLIVSHFDSGFVSDPNSVLLIFLFCKDSLAIYRGCCSHVLYPVIDRLTRSLSHSVPRM